MSNQEIEKYMSENTKLCISTLQQLFGEDEIQISKDEPHYELSLWNAALKDYTQEDIENACMDLAQKGKFKHNIKLMYLMTYLRYYKKTINVAVKKDNKNIIPYEYLQIREKASRFSTICNLWINPKYIEEAKKINDKMCKYALKNKNNLSDNQYKFLLFGIGRCGIITDELSKNIKHQYNKYDDNYLNFLEQYKLGWFEKYEEVINKFSEKEIN